MHVSDLFPTLLGVAGLKLDTNKLNLDGVDQWKVINKGGFQARKEVVNLDNVFGFGMYMLNSYKLVNGSFGGGAFNTWLYPKNDGGYNDPYSYAISVLNSQTSRAIYSTQRKYRLNIDKILQLRQEATVKCGNQTKKNSCDVTKAPCLFNIQDDPCEENNLANEQPAMLNFMLKRYNEAVNSAVPSIRKSIPDPACDPKNFDFNWEWWQADS